MHLKRKLLKKLCTLKMTTVCILKTLWISGCQKSNRSCSVCCGCLKKPSFIRRGSSLKQQGQDTGYQTLKFLACNCCQTEFKGSDTKHYCRACGMGVCNNCSESRPVALRGWDHPVRVCDQCAAKKGQL